MERSRVVDNQEFWLSFPNQVSICFLFKSLLWHLVFCTMKWLGAGEGGGQRVPCVGPWPAWRAPQILRGDRVWVQLLPEMPEGVPPGKGIIPVTREQD